VRLRPKAFAVLRYLVQRPNRLVTKAELLHAVWPDTHLGEVVLKVCVRELRAALGDRARAPRFIETVHARGHRFVGRVGSRPAKRSPVAP
jgi:DNA-binding winged helix-turn-helix (wHTH) protein